MEAEFSINVKGIYCVLESICNPILDIEFNIELIGCKDDVNDLHSSWHLDKHNFSGGNENQFFHPEYHFTFGGRRMWDSGKDYGATLILSSPRFFHPPMDGILGIDFVLQNYISKDNRKEITKDRIYQKLLFNSQLRIWRPYWLSIASAWDSIKFEQMSFPHHSLVPNLICKV